MALENISRFLSPSFVMNTALTKMLGEDFILCDNGNMVFHWADFFETCDMIKAHLQNDSEMMKDFHLREKALLRLDSIPVWIKTENKIHQTSMYKLYESYILNQSQLLGTIDPFCPLDISFISGTGPFKNMSVAECFNNSTYRDFILVFLIQEKLPRRDYRIRLKSKILLEYGEHYADAELIALEQLTMNGMLVSIESELYLKKVMAMEDVRILINSKMLADGRHKSLGELKSYLSQFAFNLLYSSKKEDSVICKVNKFSVQSSFDFSKNKKIFLFIHYDDMVSSDPESINLIKEFVAHTKDLVLDYYRPVQEKNIA